MPTYGPDFGCDGSIAHAPRRADARLGMPRVKPDPSGRIKERTTARSPNAAIRQFGIVSPHASATSRIEKLSLSITPGMLDSGLSPSAPRPSDDVPTNSRRVSAPRSVTGPSATATPASAGAFVHARTRALYVSRKVVSANLGTNPLGMKHL
jgi:hypothetical protein